MPIFDESLSNTVVVSQSQAGTEESFLENAVSINQILCYDGEFNSSLISGVVVGNYLTGYRNDLSDIVNWPDQGIVPQTQINLFGTWLKRLFSSVLISQELLGEGGLVYDYSCNPPALIPNLEIFDWGTFTDDEWGEFDENQWNYFSD